MKICAIDLKANNTILVVVEKNDEKIQYIDLKIKKIELEDDEIQENIISYSKTINDFLQENKIEQVLINLLKNAREACNRKLDKNIQVKVKKLSAGNTALTISDNGEGILPDVLDKIFVPFFTTKTSGSGIG